MKIKLSPSISANSANVSHSAKVHPLLEETVNLLMKKFPKNSLWATKAKKDRGDQYCTLSINQADHISVLLNSASGKLYIEFEVGVDADNFIWTSTPEFNSAEKVVNSFLSKYQRANKSFEKRIETLKGMTI